MELANALRADRTLRLALVGAGGKSRLMFRLAGQLSATVFVSASTHLAKYQVSWGGRHWILGSQEDLAEIPWEGLDGVQVFTGPFLDDGRVSGLGLSLLNAIRAKADRMRIPLLVEADGSRQRPLKAPAGHEPAIPPFANHVAVCVNLSAIGKPLSDVWVHRPERFARLSSLVAGEQISLQGLLRFLKHAEGGLKRIPPDARRTAVLAGGPLPDFDAHIDHLAAGLLDVYHSVVGIRLAEDVTSTELEVTGAAEAVAGLVLAAGESRRMGTPKQLLEWEGQPLVRKAALTAIEAGCTPVFVVTGASGERVSAALEGLPVEIVRNSSWQLGQSSSVRAGVQALPPHQGAAVFLLVDQPQTPVELVRELIAAHRRTLAPVVAPQIQGQRANPVLFDRATFPELASLEGDIGGRALFERYPIHWVAWDDPRQLIDVDTLEDYGRLLRHGL